MIQEWLVCPVCGASGDDIDIGGDFEHLRVACTTCGTGLKEYHGEFEQWLPP